MSGSLSPTAPQQALLPVNTTLMPPGSQWFTLLYALQQLQGISANWNAITELQNQTSGLAAMQADITTLQGDVTTINTTLTSLQNQINTINTRLANAGIP